MAFIYPELKKYYLDIPELRRFLYSHYRFNFEYFDQWIDGWINVFTNAERDTDTQIDNLMKHGVPNFEVFLQNVHFGEITFKFNFIINGAREYIKKKQVKAKKINASKFSENIKWTKESGKTSHELTEPIFITGLPMDNYTHVVIDGNHRLTELLEKGVTEIKYIEIPPIDILKEKILIFTIDKAIYAFMIEIKKYQLSVRKNEYPHKLLFESSNINNAFKDLNY